MNHFGDELNRVVVEEAGNHLDGTLVIDCLNPNETQSVYTYHSSITHTHTHSSTHKVVLSARSTRASERLTD